MVGAFGEPKMGCGVVVGAFGESKKSYGDGVGVFAVSFWHKKREATPFWRHLSLICEPWAGVTPRSGLRA